MAWTMAMTESDTGWTPAGGKRPRPQLHPWIRKPAAWSGGVQPGSNRVILFVDVDGDSTFGSVPITLLAFVRFLAAEVPTSA